MTYQEEITAKKQAAAAWIESRTNEIVNALEGGWMVQIQDHDGSGRVQAVKGNQRLMFSYDKWKKRLWIHGLFPQYQDENVRQTFHLMRHDAHKLGVKVPLEISVAPDKDAKKIARDIQTRLLPGYLKALQFAVEEIAREADYKRKQNDLTAKVAAVFGEEPNDHRSRFGSMYSGCGMEADIQSASSVHVTIRIEGTPEEIATTLTKINQELAAQLP